MHDYALLGKYDSVKAEEKVFIETAVQARASFLISSAHYITYILDPCFEGLNLSQELQDRTQDVFLEMAAGQSEDKKSKVFMQLNDFLCAVKRDRNANTFRYQELI